MEVAEVSVTSPEVAAKTNEPLQEKLRSWRDYADESLRESVTRAGGQIIDASRAGDGQAVAVRLTSEVRYGNRALRWISYGGAGKGGVRSVLVATDSKTGETRFQAVSESDLAVGFAGGSIDKAFRQNISKLLAKYEDALTHSR